MAKETKKNAGFSFAFQTNRSGNDFWLNEDSNTASITIINNHKDVIIEKTDEIYVQFKDILGPKEIVHVNLKSPASSPWKLSVKGQMVILQPKSESYPFEEGNILSFELVIIKPTAIGESSGNYIGFTYGATATYIGVTFPMQVTKPRQLPSVTLSGLATTLDSDYDIIYSSYKRKTPINNFARIVISTKQEILYKGKAGHDPIFELYFMASGLPSGISSNGVQGSAPTNAFASKEDIDAFDIQYNSDSNPAVQWKLEKVISSNLAYWKITLEDTVAVGKPILKPGEAIYLDVFNLICSIPGTPDGMDTFFSLKYYTMGANAKGDEYYTDGEVTSSNAGSKRTLPGISRFHSDPTESPKLFTKSMSLRWALNNIPQDPSSVHLELYDGISRIINDHPVSNTRNLPISNSGNERDYTLKLVLDNINLTLGQQGNYLKPGSSQYLQALDKIRKSLITKSISIATSFNYIDLSNRISETIFDFAMDFGGNIYILVNKYVYIYSSAGSYLHKVAAPEGATNLCFFGTESAVFISGTDKTVKIDISGNITDLPEYREGISSEILTQKPILCKAPSFPRLYSTPGLNLPISRQFSSTPFFVGFYDSSGGGPAYNTYIIPKYDRIPQIKETTKSLKRINLSFGLTNRSQPSSEISALPSPGMVAYRSYINHSMKDFEADGSSSFELEELAIINKVLYTGERITLEEEFSAHFTSANLISSNGKHVQNLELTKGGNTPIKKTIQSTLDISSYIPSKNIKSYNIIGTYATKDGQGIPYVVVNVHYTRGAGDYYKAILIDVSKKKYTVVNTADLSFTPDSVHISQNNKLLIYLHKSNKQVAYIPLQETGLPQPVQPSTVISVNQFYHIQIHSHYDYYFDCSNDSSMPVRAQIWDEMGSYHTQQWMFMYAGGEYYYIYPRQTNCVLEIPDGNTKNGSAVQTNYYTGETNQQWKITPVSGVSDHYLLQNKQSGKCISVSGTKGSKLYQWDLDSGQTQHLFFIKC